jgi:hypothetical protein
VYERVETPPLLDHAKWSYTFYAWKVRVCVMCVYQLPKVIFVFAFYIALWQQSYMGCVFTCMLFLVLLLELRNNWTTITIPIFVLVFMQIII